MTGEEDGLAEEREVCLHVSRKMLVSSLIYMPLLLRLLFFLFFFSFARHTLRAYVWGWRGNKGQL
jgi:hypothetical protein